MAEPDIRKLNSLDAENRAAIDALMRCVQEPRDENWRYRIRALALKARSTHEAWMSVVADIGGT